MIALGIESAVRDTDVHVPPSQVELVLEQNLLQLTDTQRE